MSSIFLGCTTTVSLQYVYTKTSCLLSWSWASWKQCSKDRFCVYVYRIRVALKCLKLLWHPWGCCEWQPTIALFQQVSFVQPVCLSWLWKPVLVVHTDWTLWATLCYSHTWAEYFTSLLSMTFLAPRKFRSDLWSNLKVGFISTYLEITASILDWKW